ncbi:MAG: ABC transporter permease [Ectothiorhodospiraceae bacterium]|nr:ABC transporter permease [Ectothiorhodospiraceae bacterium]
MSVLVTVARLALRSLWNRRLTAGLTVLAIALSAAMLLGVEKVRRDARQAFADTISGTDLIVGARGGAVQLLLYSVFRIGNATNNISWETYRELAAHRSVAWTVPLSLGDSHRGYRVLGTNTEYFARYKYAGDRPLTLAAGKPFDDVFDAVLGAEVARRLGYALGDPIVVTHGAGEAGLRNHDDKPFRVSGILAPTGTPVDRTVHVSLEGIEAMHIDWKGGAPIPGRRTDAEAARKMDLEPRTITAFLVGLDSKLALFRLQRTISTYRAEPLQAIIPGVALQELWDLMGVAENALRVISVMVAVTGLLGMAAVILASLESRRREMAVLRSVGARPAHVFGLLMSESATLGLAGVATGLGLLHALVLAARPVVSRLFGLHLPLAPPTTLDLALLGAVVLAALAAGALPAWRAYRMSLADGLSPRV